MALADIKLAQAKRKALEQGIKEDASSARREQGDGAPGSLAGTDPSDPDLIRCLGAYHSARDSLTRCLRDVRKRCLHARVAKVPARTVHNLLIGDDYEWELRRCLECGLEEVDDGTGFSSFSRRRLRDVDGRDVTVLPHRELLYRTRFPVQWIEAGGGS